MEQLEEELTCPICCGLFEDPRVLLCSHSFCKKCLEGLLLEGASRASYRTPLKCPTCRKETPHNGAASLQVNYSLRGIVEKYGRIRVAPPKKACACDEHPEQPLNIFCLTDVRLICGFCATTPEHRGHAFCSVEEAVARERDALQDLLRDDVHARLETLQVRKKKTLQEVNIEAEKVAEYFDKLLASLECKRSEILGDFETLKLVVMQTFDPEIGVLSAAADEQRRAAANIADTCGDEDSLGFLRRMRTLRRALGSLEEGTPKKPRHPARITPFDARKWDSLRLDEVDKMAIPPEKKKNKKKSSRLWWIVAIVLLTVLFSFQMEVSALYSRLPRADDAWAQVCVNLRGFVDLCSPLPGAFLRYLGHSVDMALDFIDRCRFEFDKLNSLVQKQIQTLRP